MTGSEPVQCEMCGTETANPNRIKVEGAELDVCDGCTEFGTKLNTGSEESSTSTKYSTSSGSSSGRSSGSRSTSTSTSTNTSSGSTGGGGGGRSSDIYEDVDELAQNFDRQIRRARERANQSQEELARELNEKASLIRKLERGDTLPTDELQRKLERHFDIDLTAGGSVDESEWESNSSTGEYTLGDMVERKD